MSKTKTGKIRKESIPSSALGRDLKFGKIGDEFYTDKLDKDVTAWAGYYNRKVTTERLLAVSSAKDQPQVWRIVKVTIIG